MSKQMIKMCTAGGEEHGLLELLPNAVPFDDFKAMTPENKAECQKKLKRDKEIIQGQYINLEGSNERLEKIYCAGPGEPLQKWKCIPNKVYDFPRGFIDEVNASGVPEREGLVSVDGKDINNDGSPKKKDTMRQIYKIVPTKF
jgi:hypothetical protein